MVGEDRPVVLCYHLSLVNTANAAEYHLTAYEVPGGGGSSNQHTTFSTMGKIYLYQVNRIRWQPIQRIIFFNLTKFESLFAIFCSMNRTIQSCQFKTVLLFWE